MKLAFFSPLPPNRSGIADYSAMLLPRLAAEAEVTVFLAPDAPPPAGVPPNLVCRPADDYRPADFDLTLYQMGNSVHHTFVYRQLLQYPGITVLHEPCLHHFTAHITVGQGDFSAYVREMGYAYGPAGAALARAIGACRAKHPFHSLPLMERLVDSSRGVIVHSRHAGQIVEGSRPGVPLAVIAQPMPLGQAEPADPAELGIPSGSPLVVIAGQVTPEKQIPTALRSFARFREQHPDAHLVIVGEIPPWYTAIDETKSELGLEMAVHQTGYLADLGDFERWIAAADLCVNLRSPTLGETSASLLRIMALGKPALVSDVGWYAELPGEVCCHVPLTPAGEVDQEALTAAMLELADDPVARHEMGSQARAYVDQHHRLEDCARAYLSFIRATLNAA